MDHLLGFSVTHLVNFGELTPEKLAELFDDQFIWSRENTINNELQAYVTQQDGFDHGILKLTPEGLEITAIPTPEELVETSISVTKNGRELARLLGGYDKFSPEQYVQHVTPQAYSSALLTTYRGDRFKQLFGYFSIVAKLPAAEGCWPAFWLLIIGSKWPDNVGKLPEIDIFEGIKTVLEGKYHTTIHSSNSVDYVSGGTGKEIDTGLDLVNEFHEYGCLWGPDFITFFFDGKEVFKRKTPRDMLGFQNRDNKSPTKAHMLVNLAVGGWGGKPDMDHYPELATMVIKEIRVYQKNTPYEDIVYPWVTNQEPVIVSDIQDIDPKMETLVGDVVHVLSDGRVVTKRDIEIVRTYLQELSE